MQETHLAPVLPQGGICFAQVVPRDLGGHMVRHMNTDVMCQEFNPAAQQPAQACTASAVVINATLR